MKWLNLRETKLFSDKDDIYELIKIGKDTAKKLDELKYDVSYDIFNLNTFNEAVSSFTRLIFSLMSIAKTYR
ncbi:MAG: hypothetical protein J7K62_03280, partial [Thermoplasmata archaeon]|nr:hypothetical protein [Thermoplasmata archaeon]